MDPNSNHLDRGDARLPVRPERCSRRRVARRTSALTRVLFILSCSLSPAGAAHAAQWAQTYGGAGFDTAAAAQPTPDGGYVVAGDTGSFGSPGAAWVLKLDADGVVVWQRTYRAGTGIHATSVEPTDDGGYVVAGNLWVTGDNADVWVSKLDGGGNVVWQRTFGGEGVDVAGNIVATPDGGYVVAASTGSFGLGGAGGFDFWLLKLDASGNIVWQRTYGGYSWDEASTVRRTGDGGYVIAGTAGSPFAPSMAPWLLKLDANGNVQWHRAYGSALGGNAGAGDVQPTADGGYVVAGYTYSFGAGQTDAWLLKLDATGNIAWQETYGSATYDGARSVQPTSDGGYVVAGLRQFGAPDNDAWVFKVDASGNLLWQRTYGGTGDDFAYSVRSTADGGYVAGGATRSFGAGAYDVWLLKLDANGAIGGCAAMGTSNAIQADSSAIVGLPPALARVSSASPASPAITQGASTAVQKRQCYFAEPVIPALSGSGMLLLSALLALGGGIAMHRGVVPRTNKHPHDARRVVATNGD